ncbi:MAG: hypothetical protein PHD48_11660 [Alphaproteobacteria bacterium]|nr:hypothetical protein [Alphaproteobacteria bacterium]
MGIITSTALLFQVRQMAHSLGNKIALSACVGAKIDAATEMLAAAARIVTPISNKRRNKPRTKINPQVMLYGKAENYMQSYVLSLSESSASGKVRRALSDEDFHKAVQKILADLETTTIPATLLACLILNLRDARKELKDIDESGKIPASRILTILAKDIYAAKARVHFMRQSAKISNAQKIKLGREITMCQDLLVGLSEVVGAPLPQEDSKYKAAVLEDVKRKRLQEKADS